MKCSFIDESQLLRFVFFFPAVSNPGHGAETQVYPFTADSQVTVHHFPSPILKKETATLHHSSCPLPMY